ncbi:MULTISPECIES: glycosyltransferase [Burkholderia]|uniref:glycosyltransferase n=1 Tax=Burkholderia TaxID=32008 RepID=UPI00087726E8|nr:MULTISPECIES: glycosyltransferase [Burkholderia]MBR7911884.1 glycosyltransferase [Burkholderia vietnamiensis]MBR8229185.1 glycosyltransferase [Burkholderia vietnamiensis]MCA7987152.1 glycosyltransferase [Burkholderia vietnamiensis]SCZ45638.1 Glycosyltransferase involved in cell wall bisynthesis [Burkholderia vietnamiensis]SFY37054.1 Glycosyltransferase involved in cell wall bisynthesis [Burkholderia vietnamiensis]
MKVLFLIGSVGDYHTARLSDAARRLAEFNVEFSALVMNHKSADYLHRDPQRDVLNPAGTNWRYMTKDGKRRRQPMILARLFAEVVREKPDLIVTIGYNFSYSVVGLIYRWMTGRTRIVFCADSKFDDGTRCPSREMVKAWIASLYDGAIVAGRRQRVYFEFLGIPAQHILVGYDVVDNDRFMTSAAAARMQGAEFRRRMGLPEKYIICVSRLIARKRVDKAIDAYARSRARENGVSLLVIGTGELESSLRERCVRFGLADNVVFKGLVPNHEMPIFLALASFMVLLSDYDQWGLCLNEALACGTPVLCSDSCGAAHELVRHGENGFVTDGTDADIDRGMELLLDDEKLSAIKHNFPWNLGDWDLRRFSDNVLNFANRFSK